VADELLLKGIQVSSTGVRGVWMRHGLLTKHERLLRLEETARQRKLKLTDAQVRALERFDPEFRDRHIEVHVPGELVSVDTFFVGTLKGVGKVYMQGVLDCFSRYAWGRLYTSKLPLTAVQVLNNDVLPFFEQYKIRVRTVLSDNGREFCGRADQHPYELFLQLEEIEHRTTKVGRPQSNGFIERFHRTLLDEHLRVKGRTTWYESVEEMQADLDPYLELYNTKRPHRGRGMEGRTPYTVFKAGLKQARAAAGKSPRKEENKAA
jgi:transposase InsO family protein